MRIRRSLTKGLLIALALTLIPVSAISAQKITPGSTCKTLKQKVVYQNKTYSCIKSGKKLVWNKGVVVNSTPAPKIEITPLSALANASTCKVARPSDQRDVSLGFPAISHRLKGPVVRALIMPVDFPDLIADSNPVTDYTEMTKGISDWYAKISGGTVKFEWVIYSRYIRMPRNVVDYKIGARTGTGFWEYNRASIEAGDPFIDFSKFDLVITGAPPKVRSEQISTSPAFTYPLGGGIKVDGIEILNATMTAEDTMRIQQGKPGWKGIAHEIGHLMGLVDLYNISSSLSPSGIPPTDKEQFAFMGGFDFMSHVHGGAPEITAWERWLLNFLDDSQIRCVGTGNFDSTHYLTPVEFTDDKPRAVVIPVSDTKRLVVESRRSAGYDNGLAVGFEGALVYLIDVSNQSGYGPMKIISKNGATNPLLYDATLQAGDTVKYENYKITNLASDKNGDTIKVEKIGG